MERQSLPRDLVPIHYAFTLTPDFTEFKFAGEETIEVRVQHATNTFAVNSLDLNVHATEVHQGSKSFTVTNVTFDPKLEILTVNLAETLELGAAIIKFRYTGVLNDLMCGFYRSSYEYGGEKHWMASTQLQSVDARRVFLCWDEPDAKATFDISLVVPKDMDALSNMPIVEESDVAPDRRLVRFARTPRMSTYILAMAVGKFEYIEAHTREGVRVRVYTTPGKKELGQFSLRIATETLSYFNEYFGTPFPLSKLDMIGVPDFAAGAMENWGLITYREIALLVDEKQTPAARRMGIAETVAHELAHQWFGNLVTMEWWTHLWLNEGFATWVASLALDKLFPAWRIWELFLTGRTASAMELDALESSHPIEVPVAEARKIDEVFDEISYSKGGSVIRMIESFLTTPVFRNGLRLYLKRHEYSNAATGDLWKALAEASGKPVERIMASWTSQTGMPVLTVHAAPGGRLRVRQRRFLAQGARDDGALWMVPVTAVASDGTRVDFMLDQREAELPLTVPPGGWVKLNREQAGFYRVHYADAAVADPLVVALKAGALPSAMDRFGIVNDAFALAQAHEMSVVEMLKLLEGCAGDDSYIVMRSVESALSRVLRVFFGLPSQPALQRFGASILRPALRRLGWTVQPGEDHQRTLLRSELIAQLGEMDDACVVEEALRMFQQPDEIAPDLRQAVMNVAAAHGGASVFDTLQRMYHEAALSEQKVRLLRAMGCVREPAVVARALEFCKDDAVRSQDMVFLFAGLGRNPWAGDAAWRFMKANWDFFVRRYGKGGFLFSDMIQSAIEESCDAAHVEDAERFFRENPTPSAEKAIAQALEAARLNVSWRTRDAQVMADFFAARA